MKNLSFITIILIGISFTIQVDSINIIHDHLTHCYTSNYTQPWIGNSLKMFIDLIKKVEHANPTSIDIRKLSINLIHQMRIDGIRKSPKIIESDLVIPYGISGRMASKYKVLLQLISDTSTKLNFTEILSKEEICFLHSMISTSVEPFQRGDEKVVCPQTLMTGTNPITQSEKNREKIIRESNNNRGANILLSSNTLSRCPIEKGVIRSEEYGTISPGILIAAIASGLEPQNVKLGEFLSFQISNKKYENIELMDIENINSDQFDSLLKSSESIDNKFAAGLAGDLAEVCIYQGPVFGMDLRVGLSGSWNDSLFPRLHYFSQNHQGLWDMTDAEILTGIDSLFLSHKISNWMKTIRTLRLSQIIEMYYSEKGIPAYMIENSNTNNFNEFDEEFSANEFIRYACDRMKIFESIDVNKLKNETFNFAQILQQSASSVTVTNEILKKNCDTTVDQFMDYSKILLDRIQQCDRQKENPIKNKNNLSVDLTLIIDGSRTEYDNQRLINFIAELIDVSVYNSQISVIHGYTGEYLVNRTNSIASMFVQLKKYNGTYPNNLSLTQSLASVIRVLSNQTENELTNRKVGGNSQVVLIMSQKEKISQTEFNNARRMFENSLLQFPDLYFIFITNDANSFEELTKGVRDLNNKNSRSEYYKIISSNSIDPIIFKNELRDHINNIPKKIIVPYCRSDVESQTNQNIYSGMPLRDEYEDYLTPELDLIYKVNGKYLANTDEVKFNFVGFDYGDFTVCYSREISSNFINCKTIRNNQDGHFNITTPCEKNDCKGIYFKISVDHSNLRCFENDCRYPDQVRFIIRHEGLRCTTNIALKIIVTKFVLFLSLCLIYLLK